MATVRLAAASLLTTVSKTAGTVNDLLSTVSTGAKMLNDYAEDARQKQKLNLAVTLVGYEETLLSTRMVEIDQVLQKAEEYMGNDQAKRDRCAVHYAKLTEALKKAKGEA